MPSAPRSTLGVAQSINSDVNSLMTVLNMSNMLPRRSEAAAGQGQASGGADSGALATLTPSLPTQACSPNT